RSLRRGARSSRRTRGYATIFRSPAVIMTRWGRSAPGCQQIADVNDPFRIVERLVVDHQTRMRGTFEHAHQFAERNVALDRDDVGAMDHHIGDPPFLQAE